MTSTATIFHRIDEPFVAPAGLDALDAKWALAYQITLPDGCGDGDATLENIFAACGNSPYTPAPGWDDVCATHVDACRRSLSVGDAVRLPDGRAFIVEGVGFRRVPRGLFNDDKLVPYFTYA